MWGRAEAVQALHKLLARGWGHCMRELYMCLCLTCTAGHRAYSAAVAPAAPAPSTHNSGKLLMELEEYREQLKELLEGLPAMWANNRINENCAGAAIEVRGGVNSEPNRKETVALQGDTAAAYASVCTLP